MISLVVANVEVHFIIYSSGIDRLQYCRCMLDVGAINMNKTCPGTRRSLVLLEQYKREYFLFCCLSHIKIHCYQVSDLYWAYNPQMISLIFLRNAENQDLITTLNKLWPGVKGSMKKKYLRCFWRDRHCYLREFYFCLPQKAGDW